MITISVNGAQQTGQFLQAYPNKADRALVRALNRSLGSARTVLVRGIAQETKLRQSDVRAALKERLATFSRPEASIGASLKRIPLIKFNARGPEPSRGRGRGVSYRLGSGRNRHPRAFIATMGSGHRGVFVRSGKTRLPIRELFGPSLGAVFKTFEADARARASETFAKNFAHELQFASTEGASAGGPA